MEDKRICINFCVKYGFKGAEIFWMLQAAYADAVMSRRRVFEWHKRFKEGREETADNERSGRPSTSTTPEKVDKELELLRVDRRITVREVAEEAGISFGSTQSIMKNILGVRKLNAVLFPKDLTFDQKNARKETASFNLEATTDDPELMKRVITGDETWIYGFDSETTQQASEWRFKNKPRPKKARKAPRKVKVMLTVFLRIIKLAERQPLSRYQGVLDRLRFIPIKKMDQRTCIKFCVKNEIKCADAFRMLTVTYGEATLDRSNVYRWYKMFSEGRKDVNDEERAGRPSTSKTDEKINEVEKMILANRRITVREVAEDLNILIGSCHSIFINDLGMRRVAAKFVPKLLNCDQKQHRMNIANEMLDSVRDDPNLLQRVITGNEAWVYGYDVGTKAQSSQWKLPHKPRPKKARQVRSNVKFLLTVFFDCRGVVHHEFLPHGRTVNEEYYLQVMRNLREAIRQKRPDLWKNKNWLLPHDNAPAHTSLLVRDLLAKNNTLMMPQPPYSPDLAPCDFFLFPKLKRPMKGRRYATLDEIKTASKEELKKIFLKMIF
ncbi:hypothetical protein LAZ67_11000634 [Cordylochernes scorpioides]|uniref:Mos1 transposase HTH domain-containing protein n=1 Tax=Cordylochernes scorpioides TaxID=51811 RepID=A0ABY6KYE2_9ARAC|nr:hypothetical protein LAZ67_11000634 [Cordylochernes scorpioides]